MLKKYLCLGLAALLIAWNGLTASVWLQQRALASRLIRLHIVAASDAPEDQARKLRVRDALLPEITALTADCADADTAGAALAAALPALEQTAVRALGTGEPVTARLAEEGFPRRDYASFSLPAGRYRALRLTLGAGEGHNWWCVAFPALCLPAAAEFRTAAADAGLTADQIELVSGEAEPVRFKFRLLELLGALFG